MNLRVKSLSGAFALACGLLFLVVLWPACGCLPTEYQEVEVAGLPETVLSNVGRIEPGIRPRRAWAFWLGGRREDRTQDGYLIRGGIPGSWWDKQVKVYTRAAFTEPDSVVLEPID